MNPQSRGYKLLASALNENVPKNRQKNVRQEPTDSVYPEEKNRKITVLSNICLNSPLYHNISPVTQNHANLVDDNNDELICEIIKFDNNLTKEDRSFLDGDLTILPLDPLFEESVFSVDNDYKITTGIPSSMSKSSDIAEPKFENNLKDTDNQSSIKEGDQNKQVDTGNEWLAAEEENTTADENPHFEQFGISMDKENGSTRSTDTFIPCNINLTDITEAKLEENFKKTENQSSTEEEDLNNGNKSETLANEWAAMEDENTTTDEDENNGERRKRKRKKARLSDHSQWEYNKNKRMREEGLSYLGRKDNQFTVKMNEKSIKKRCTCQGTKKSKIQCYKLSEEERKNIFKKFWSLTWDEKNIFVRGRGVMNNVKRARNRKEEGKSQRTCSFTFYLEKKYERIRVCKTMFCSTLGMSARTISKWLNDLDSLNKSNEIQNEHENENETPTANISIQTRSNDNKKRQIIKQFLDTIPKLPSHYCRKSTSKLYLEPSWKSKSELYSLYKDNWCQERQIDAASSTLFSYVFEEMNLALFTPKKDECDVCVGYRTKNIKESKYQMHIDKKEEAQKENKGTKYLPIGFLLWTYSLFYYVLNQMYLPCTIKLN